MSVDTFNSEDNIPIDTIVNLRLPTFSVDDPRIWFLQIEAAFSTRRIKSERTRFSLVVEALPHQTAKSVSDILENIPTEFPYTKLKEAIIKRSGFSESRDIKELFTTVELGDRTPSQLLRHMRSLLNGRSMDNALLIELWVDKLPMAMQHILAALPKDSDIDNIADTADRIAESYHTSVASVSPQRAVPQNSFESTLNAFITEIRQCFREQHRAKPRFRRRSKSNTNDRKKLCWYHHKFGHEAHKCIQPCDFSKSNLNGPARQ